jgi:hypothetical protein
MGYQLSHGSAAHALRPGPEASGVARNRILLALAPQERARLLEMLQLVTFRLGDVLCEAGARMEYVYFPATCVVASLYTTEEGATAEMYLVGNDGVASVSPFLGFETASNTSVVVVAGEAYRMKARTLHQEFAAGGPLQSLLLRYTQVLIMQPAPRRRTAPLPMAADVPRPRAVQRAANDAGVHLEHARRPP